MKFYVINRTDANFGETIFDNARSVAVYMLGRRMDHYHILKEDELGARIVSINGGDVLRLQESCERT
jgi:hypothetical protein